MKPKSQRRKRPCRICGKWFTPNPRVGNRQKTCGDKECQKIWHTKVCAEWNRKNRGYFKAIYLKAKLDSFEASPSAPSTSASPPPQKNFGSQRASPLDLPLEVVQEVMSRQQVIIIEYIMRLLLRGVQEVKRIQLLEIHEKSKQLPRPVISRGDSPKPPS